MNARKLIFLIVLLASGLLYTPLAAASAPPAPNPLSGSEGLEGKINSAPPATAPSIGTPSNGQSFSNIPITVSGLCQSGLLVEIFNNNVFAGSVVCSNGSFTLQIDLFSGQNDLIARDYDALNQASPDSNKVTVNFNSGLPSTGSLVLLTTQYAKRGADPGTDLTWPISLSGGTGPYAISVDWGDNSKLDLISQQFPGDITLHHTYKTAGTFNVIIKATDSTGSAAFLQVVGVANGPIQQTKNAGSGTTIKIERVVPLWALIILLVLMLTTFWLGKRHQLQTIRARLRNGQPPFG